MGEAPAFLVDDPPKDSSTVPFFPSVGSQTVTIIGDKRYVIGGEDDGPASSIGVKISDKFTREGLSLTVLGTKPKPCKSHSAVALNDDRILVLSRNSSPEESFWFLEVDTKFVREQKKNLKTEVVSWSKGVVGDTEKLIVISGPSGVGKGTLISKLMKEFTSMFGFSVSHTTRAPRENETDGVHYHFIRRNTMDEEIEMGKFLEFANVHGNLYGTSVEAVQVVANAGKRCILDIDVQGARSVRASSLEAFFIFICPPSMEELEKRLRARGTETDEQIEKRVENASKELEDAKSPGLFDHFLQNDDLEKCYNDLKKLLGLEGSAIATHKSSMEMSNLPRDHSVSGHRFLIRNQEPDKASKSLLLLDASSLKGGAPGRTRGLKLYSTETHFHTTGMEFNETC